MSDILVEPAMIFENCSPNVGSADGEALVSACPKGCRVVAADLRWGRGSTPSDSASHDDLDIGTTSHDR